MNNTINPARPDSCEQAISTHGRTARRIWTPEEPLDDHIQKMLVGMCLTAGKERCGFISSDEDIWNVKNVHAEPRHNFFMDEEDTRRVVEEIYDGNITSIVGMWHTHPNNVPWPTARDLVGWPNPALGWRYWIVTNREVLEWELRVNCEN